MVLRLLRLGDAWNENAFLAGSICCIKGPTIDGPPPFWLAIVKTRAFELKGRLLIVLALLRIFAVFGFIYLYLDEGAPLFRGD